MKTTAPAVNKAKARRKETATCFDDKSNFKKIGVIEDEEDVPMTDYNRIDRHGDDESLPVYDLIPIDDQNVERETLQTGSEEAPYGGATWNTIPRDAIAQIHAIFSPVEQTAMPHFCLRVMLQKVHDENGEFIQQPEHDASYSKQSPHINYQI